MSAVSFKTQYTQDLFTNSIARTRVDYHGQNLTELPDDFDYSNTELSILILDNNDFTSLPASILTHPSLTILSLTNNKQFRFKIDSPLPEKLSLLHADGVEFDTLPKALLKRLPDPYFNFRFSLELLSDHAKAQLTPIRCLRFLQNQGGYVLRFLAKNEALSELVNRYTTDINALLETPRKTCEEIVIALNEIIRDYPFRVDTEDLIQNPAETLKTLENSIVNHDKEQKRLAAEESAKKKVHFGLSEKPKLTDKQLAIQQIISHSSAETIQNMLCDAKNIRDFLKGISFTFAELFNYVHFDELKQAAPGELIVWAEEILNNPNVREICQRVVILELKKTSHERSLIKCYKIPDRALDCCPKLKTIRLGPETLLELSPLAATKYEVYKTYVNGSSPKKCDLPEYASNFTTKVRRVCG
jgi:hypothetical protein